MALAIDMLHDLVVGTKFLLVCSHHAVYSINRCVCYELLEVWHLSKVCHIRVENHVVSHANVSVDVLVVLALADSVGEAPGSSFLAVGLDHLLALRLVDTIVVAHVDEGLLVEELLLEVADHLLSESLDTKASGGLDEFGANGQLTTLLHLTQVLIMLRPMLRVRDLIDIFAHQVLEFCLIHSLGELIKFFGADVHLLSLVEGMVNLFVFLFGLGVDSNPIEVFGGVGVYHI